MALGRCTTIPRAFSYVLPVQSLITGVVVYGVVFAYTVHSTVFILGVVATGLQFFLGIYCCFLGAKVGIYHRFIIPAWLVALAAVWAVTLYYVTVGLDAELKLKQSSGAGYSLLPGRGDGDGHIIWRAVAVGGSAVNCFIDLVLLAIFFVIGLRRVTPVGFNPNPVSAPPTAQVQQPAFAPMMAPAAMAPAMAPAATFYQGQPAHQTGSAYAVATPAAEAHMKQQQIYGHTSPLGSNPSMGTMGTMGQYHQQQQQYTAAQAATHIGTSPSPAISSTADGGKSPAAATISTTTAVVSVYGGVGTPGGAAPYDPHNRIELLRRIISLQAPDGHWDWSSELQDILALCGRQISDASPATVTSAACALAVDICQFVWSAQREGRDHTALSAAEMFSLQGMNWDLSWAKTCTDNAAVWLSSVR